MATTASGITIPGTDPTTTALTPLADRFNDLAYSLNGKVVVEVATTTARAALVVALLAEGYTISAAHPLYTHRADATAGSQLEVTTNGTSWLIIPALPVAAVAPAALTPIGGFVPLTGSGAALAEVDHTGRVRLSGAYLWSLTSVDTQNFAIATLPAACRPDVTRVVTIGTQRGSAALTILASGLCSVLYTTVVSVTQNVWWGSFDGATFRLTEPV